MSKTRSGHPRRRSPVEKAPTTMRNRDPPSARETVRSQEVMKLETATVRTLRKEKMTLSILVGSRQGHFPPPCIDVLLPRMHCPYLMYDKEFISTLVPPSGSSTTAPTGEMETEPRVLVHERGLNLSSDHDEDTRIEMQDGNGRDGMHSKLGLNGDDDEVASDGSGTVKENMLHPRMVSTFSVET
ncbi:Thioredoxin-like protein Clot [Olea europaea subsp. europaea]|uniref:Thioredoxin-like protein Clot n=1 Tax=Olea europaea subsp. europaea TaxID=158383 RepID=A0A8S0Q4M4_OLEEU|nr:Thioredoxin-like protein Clot [Olea europaea subsp. europaea]